MVCLAEPYEAGVGDENLFPDTAELQLLIRDQVIETADRQRELPCHRLNLENLILISRAICIAAQGRNDSRGAHFREDHPGVSELSASRYTVVRFNDRFSFTTEPVNFTRVQPGDTLLRKTA